MVEYDSPVASIRITRARRASSARILRLRTRRSSSARSSVVNVSAIWRQTVPVLLQSVQATRRTLMQWNRRDFVIASSLGFVGALGSRSFAFAQAQGPAAPAQAPTVPEFKDVRRNIGV